jgi:hypothetical protein
MVRLRSRGARQHLRWQASVFGVLGEQVFEEFAG